MDEQTGNRYTKDEERGVERGVHTEGEGMAREAQQEV